MDVDIVLLQRHYIMIMDLQHVKVITCYLIHNTIEISLFNCNSHSTSDYRCSYCYSNYVLFNSEHTRECRCLLLI